MHRPRRSWSTQIRTGRVARRRARTARRRAGRRAGHGARRWSSRRCCRTGARTRSGRSSAQTARDQLTCGCHVHVEVADDEEGVRILDHLRPWTAVLLALSATARPGRARTPATRSYRSQVWGRWPTAGPTAPFGDAAGYRARDRRPAALGHDPRRGDGLLRRPPLVALPDRRGAGRDVCLDADDAALQAALVRGLAETRSPAGRRRPAAHRAAAGRGLAGRALRADGRPGRAPCPGTPRPGRGGRRDSSSTTSGTRSAGPATSSGSSTRSRPCCGAATVRSSSWAGGRRGPTTTRSSAAPSTARSSTGAAGPPAARPGRPAGRRRPPRASGSAPGRRRPRPTR